MKFMHKMKISIILMGVLSFSYPDRGLADAFGFGASSCRDSMDAGLMNAGALHWAMGYINAADADCHYIGKRRCVAERLHNVPGVGVSFYGRINYSYEISNMLFAECRSNMDETLQKATIHVLFEIFRIP